MAGNVPLPIDAGATFIARVVFSEASVPVDVTGYTARMMVRRHVDSDDPPTLSLTSDSDGGIKVGSTDGLFTITITDTQTSALVKGTYHYDLEIISPSPDLIVTRLIEGKITVKPEVTR